METLPLLIGFVVIWLFLVILPTRKENRLKKEMQENLKKGDRVLVQAGMIGKVHSTKPEEVILEFDGAKITFLKSTVVRLVDKDGEAKK